MIKRTTLLICVASLTVSIELHAGTFLEDVVNVVTVGQYDREKKKREREQREKVEAQKRANQRKLEKQKAEAKAKRTTKTLISTMYWT